MSSLDKENTAPETSKKPSGTENIKNIAKQDILDLSNDEHLNNMKERYGKWVESFVKGIRTSDEYGNKCKGMSDYEVLEFGKSEPGLKEYHKQYIDRTPKNMQNYDAVSHIENNELWAFSQKEYTRLRKEKGQEAAARYAQQWKTTKLYKKPEDKEKDEKKEVKKETVENTSEKKEEKVEEKTKEQETKPEKKEEPSKEKTPPVEKSESKPEEKKPEVKKEKKKHFRSGRFKKKEKSEKKPEEKKEKKAGFISRVGSWIGSGVKAIPHQTWNLVSYAPRVARSSLKYVGFDWINHGLNKPGLKKNRDNYTSKWKWEQTKKK